MLLAGGPSDGGGAGSGEAAGGDGLLELLPIGLSLLAIAISLVTLWVNTRKTARERVWDYLQMLISAETTKLRSTVGAAARWEDAQARARMSRLSNAKLSPRTNPIPGEWVALHAKDRDAIFGLLWVVALAGPALDRGSWVHRFVVGGSTDLYRAQVYQHLALIVPDLHQAYDYWISGTEAEGSAKLADASLNGLPGTQVAGMDRRFELPEERFSGSERK